MSSDGISALERGHRRTPQRETLALLAGALALDGKQREAFEATAARSVLPRCLGGASVAIGPWGETRLSNLPLALTSFVGREAEVEEISALVREHRMVTLTGVGGVGKTQTALHVATALSEGGDVPVCFVGLAPVTDPKLVVTAIATTLGVREVPDRPLLGTLLAHLRNNRLLLILDNCEHIIAQAAMVAETLLARCARLRILVTSREPLRAAGEHSYRLPSLSFPSLEAGLEMRATEATAYGVIILFADRARAVDHRFTLTDQNVPIVAEICRRLDGIPLAIELAAARVNHLSLKAVAQKLNDGFRILSGSPRSALARQRTMRATIDWSFELLSGPEKVLARRLAVFAGGWTLEAAEAVCSFEPFEPEQIPDLLASLVDKSLVTVDFSNGEARYRFLETIRAYALEKLAASLDSAMIPRRHAEWAADYGEWLVERLFYAQGAWGQQVHRGLLYEAANRKEAWEWAFGAQETLLAGRIAGCQSWAASPSHMHLIEATLARITATEHRSVEARLWYVLARETRGESSLDAARRAVVLFGQLGERSQWLGHALSQLQYSCLHTNRPEEALAASEQLLTLLPELAATGLRIHSLALRQRADILKDLRRYEESRQCVVEAIRLSTIRTQWLAAMTTLAEVESDMGNIRQAAAVADEAAAAVPRIEWPGLFWSDVDVMAVNRINAAAYRLMLGEVDEARLAALDGLELERRDGPRNHTIPTQHLATVGALRGDAHRAARLKGFVDAWYAATGEIRFPTEQRTYEILVAALEERLSKTDINRLSAEGALLDEDEAVAMALAMGRTPFATG